MCTACTQVGPGGVVPVFTPRTDYDLNHVRAYLKYHNLLIMKREGAVCHWC